MRRRTLLRLSLEVELAVAPSATLEAALIETVLKHALFVHGQIPSPYDAIVKELAGQQQVSRDRKASRRRAMLRKARKLVGDVESLLETLPSALDAITAAEQEVGSSDDMLPVRAALAIGGSISSPRLVFLLSFVRGCPAEQVDCGADPSSSHIDKARRKLVRTLMTHCGDLGNVNTGLSRLHLLLQAPQAACLPPPFQPRPAFRLKLQRAHACRVHFESMRPPSAVVDASCDGPSTLHCMLDRVGAPIDGFQWAEQDSDEGGVGTICSRIWFHATNSAVRGFGL